MMSTTEINKPIENTLNKLSLDETNNEKRNDSLLDITLQIDELCSKLNAKDIVKERYFDLFQGTHSLEVNNVKLDSFLIPLTLEEINFDCNIDPGNDKVTNFKYVTSIADRLLRSVVCWLNEYQSLPTTLLSCRYMEHLLDIGSSHNQAFTSYETGNPLYDKVLSSYVIGISYFASFLKSLLWKRVIYEEEDLNFNFMGVQGFDKLPKQGDVLKALDESIAFLQNGKGTNQHIENQYCEHLINLLKVSYDLVNIENIITHYSSDTQYLDELIKVVAKLEVSSNDLELEVPEGSFSMSIQKKLSNQFPPKQLVEPTKNYLGLATMASDIKLVLRVAEIDTAVEALQFAWFFNKLKQRHVLARALFPLFLVRESGQVVGKYNLEDFVYSHCMEFSLMGTNILEQVGQSSELSDTLTARLQECGNVLYEFYQNASQNTARYRQGYNRQLLLWDSAQAQLETVEMDMISNGLHDVVAGVDGSEIPLMPYASWVFTMKVIAMIEFTLKGFDLEVYKPYETFDMYYYVYHLSHQLEACLDKVHQFIKKKIDSIHAMNKRIKKLKAGEKKERLRKEYNEIVTEQLEQLQVNKQYLSYLLLQCGINKSMSLFQVLQFSLLKSVKLIDNIPEVNSKFINPKLLHGLRFKTFSSIGVPELPDYNSFQEILQGFVIKEEINSPSFFLQVERIKDYMVVQLDQATTSIKSIIRAIEANDKNGELYTGTKLVKEEALDYYNRYLGSTISLRSNLEKNIKVVKKKSFHGNVTLEFDPDSSSFFPMLKVNDKNTK